MANCRPAGTIIADESANWRILMETRGGAMTNHDEQLKVLLAKASQETDPRKLDKITAEINELLEKESAEPMMDERRST